MNEPLVRAMMQLIGSEVFGTALDKSVPPLLTEDFLKQLFLLSKWHDLAHIVCAALEKNRLLPQCEVGNKFSKQMMMAVYRYQQLNYESERIFKTLEEAKIPYLPLKGTIIRRYYPEPWLRTSCDIDVLVHESDLVRSIELLVSTLSYEDKTLNYHDASLYTQTGFHLELHYSVQEDLKNADLLLADAWNYALPVSDGSYRYQFRDDFFLFYFFAHASKHFLSGGCGVRPLIDLYLLRQKMPYDAVALETLLKKGGIQQFANAMEKLGEVWFGQAEADKNIAAMGKFVLSGGVYGHFGNRISVGRAMKGSDFRYMLSRLWMPYRLLKIKYPVLKRHKWLFLAAQVWRLLTGLLSKRTKMEIRVINDREPMGKNEKGTSELLTVLGLKEDSAK